MKLLLTGAFNWNEDQIALLKKDGWDILFVEREDAPLGKDVFDVDVVICNWFFVNHDIKKFKSLKGIQLLSAGLDRIPLDYIKKQGITLFNARGVYSIPMAESAISGVLDLYKRRDYFRKNQEKHQWIKNRDVLELWGKHICVIGAGNVGTEVAKRFRAFTDQVFGIDIFPHPNQYMQIVYPLERLEKELNISDVVILTLPLSNETKNMFSSTRFAQMKQGSVFVNIARGGLVEDDALCQALDSHLLGAVSDVFQEEPLPVDSPLWGKKNLIITPHNSFVSENNNIRMWGVIWDNMQNYIRQNGKGLAK